MLKPRHPADEEQLDDQVLADRDRHDVDGDGYADRADSHPQPYSEPTAEYPAAARPVVASTPTVVTAPQAAEMSRADEVTTTDRAFSVGQILIMLCGAALLALGIVATVRGGLDGPLDEPVVEVLGFTHTPLLGLVEMGAGAVLLLAGMTVAGRAFAGFFGILLIVAGAVVLAELDWSVEKLGTEQDFGWVPIVIGAITLLASMIPAKRRRVTTVESSAARVA
jgi:hypothetical protein